MKKFNEIREFWENFKGDDLKTTQIVNPNFQPSSNYFSSLSIMMEIGELPIETILPKWHTMNGFDDKFNVTGKNNNSTKSKMK